ncbi:MAG: hypothetical protein QXE20_00360 [Acidilobaceae archaeon]
MVANAQRKGGVSLDLRSMIPAIDRKTRTAKQWMYSINYSLYHKTSFNPYLVLR